MGIKLENVSYIYEVGTAMQTAALEDVSLEIPENQFIGLIGHTGSGKSTLVQLLNGLLKPTEGRVLYNGKNIHEQDYDKRALRAEVGLVFQYPEHQLFEADVLSDVMFGPRNLGLDEAACKKSAVEALTSVGWMRSILSRRRLNCPEGRNGASRSPVCSPCIRRS